MKTFAYDYMGFFLIRLFSDYLCLPMGHHGRDLYHQDTNISQILSDRFVYRDES